MGIHPDIVPSSGGRRTRSYNMFQRHLVLVGKERGSCPVSFRCTPVSTTNYFLVFTLKDLMSFSSTVCSYSVEKYHK